MYILRYSTEKSELNTSLLEGGSNEDSSGDKQNEERKARENISEIKNELSEKINKSTSLGQAEGRERRHR